MIGIERLMRPDWGGRQYVRGAGDTGPGYDGVCVNEKLNDGTYQLLLELFWSIFVTFCSLYLMPLYLPNLQNLDIDLRAERGQ